ncbi:MAG TPA: erythromycin esterase family protein [Bryobacteraceae bacterium]|nr:erythromycin esterase family protein [Bryobacteraceae bacterium]
MRRIAPLALLIPVLGLGQINLDLKQGRAGEVPPGWFVMDPTFRGFTASWEHEGCHGQSPCATLSAPATAVADSLGTLMQSFAAMPFRGQTVQLRGWVRMEKKAPGGHAQMLLHVSRPDFQQGFADTMADRPIVSGEWAQYEIEGYVAQDAQTIQIGFSVYGTGRAWIGGIEFGPAAARTSGPAVDAARADIAKQYARMDAAFVRGDGNEIAAVLMPGAQMGVGTIREPLLPAIQGEIAKGEKLTTRTEISSLRLDGDEAIAMVRREAQDPQSGGKRSVITSHRDTWIRASDGWRWRESIEVSYHWVLPPTLAEAARPVIAELKTRAVPAGGDGELAAFGAAVGDARIVVLGEAAHGTREFAEIKQRLVDYLFAHKGFTILAAARDGDAPPRAGFMALDEVTPAVLAHLAGVDHPQAKIVLWTDNTHARDPQLREKFGRKLYAVGFAFDRGEIRAVGVEKGESKGLNTYTAQASPEGSGDAVLSGAAMPQFFLNMAKLPGGALARWLADLHLFHDLGAYWVLDDPDASLQPEPLSACYDGLYFVEEIHSPNKL